MRQLTCAFGLVLLVTLWQSAESRSLVKRQLEHGHAAIEPGHGDHHDDAFRDKKKVEAKWGFKNALIGLVFNPSSQSSYSHKTTRKPKIYTTTTEDIVIFEKNQPVSIDLPPELFNSGFQLITNVSKRIGDFMLDSGFRAHRLLESMRPFFWKIFGKKGFVIEATTDKPIFTDPNEKNEIKK
ncbi:uncharacterized protein [Onthophagus taurus]|uniref:uncharacterized protein isoform X2 n=1 Tax=Onthophagus taurus TaxID=166361 RepID=UPI0039BEC9C0